MMLAEPTGQLAADTRSLWEASQTISEDFIGDRDAQAMSDALNAISVDCAELGIAGKSSTVVAESVTTH